MLPWEGVVHLPVHKLSHEHFCYMQYLVAESVLLVACISIGCSGAFHKSWRVQVPFTGTPFPKGTPDRRTVLTGRAFLLPPGQRSGVEIRSGSVLRLCNT